MTSSLKCNEKNIKSEIIKIVEKRIREDSIDRKDIYKIVQVIDTDGAFVGKENIYLDETRHFHYSEDGIYSDNVDQVIQRNGHKKKNVKILVGTKQINSLPYNLYFMSCNFEHLLFGPGKMNASKEEKIELCQKYYADCQENMFLPKLSIFNSKFSAIT